MVGPLTMLGPEFSGNLALPSPEQQRFRAAVAKHSRSRLGDFLSARGHRPSGLIRMVSINLTVPVSGTCKPLISLLARLLQPSATAAVAKTVSCSA